MPERRHVNRHRGIDGTMDTRAQPKRYMYTHAHIIILSLVLNTN